MVLDRDQQAAHLIKMCEHIARRFKRPDHFDDLRQEGLLVMYEILDKEPAAQDVKLYREARRRMHDYLNLDCGAFSIPASDLARRLVRDVDADLTNVMTTWSDNSISQLRSALKLEQVSEDQVTNVEPSTERQYEDKEFSRLLDERLNLEFDSDEQLFFFMRYEEGMTLVEIADFFGKHKATFSRKEKDLLNKVKAIVAKLQQ